MTSDFWQHVGRLADSYVSCGRTTNDRIAGLAEHFRNLSPVAQKEVLGSLQDLAMHLPDLYTVVALQRPTSARVNGNELDPAKNRADAEGKKLEGNKMEGNKTAGAKLTGAVK
jgi:hypothetical protein